MIASHRVVGETLAGRLQEFGRHSEVTLSRSDVEVTEVGSELRKQSLDVLAGAIPRDDTVHARGVAKYWMPIRGHFSTPIDTVTGRTRNTRYRAAR